MVASKKPKTIKKAEKSSTSAKEGSKVSLHYEGKLETGEIFDSSTHGDHSHPLEFTVGAKQVIPGFERAVIGMKKGDKKEFKILPGDAYGEINPGLVKEVPRESFPQGHEPKEGMTLIMSSPQGQRFPVKIAKVTNKSIFLDMNHPLAGKKLIFNIEVINVE